MQRKKDVITTSDLLEKYQDVDRRLTSTTEEIQNALKQLFLVDSKIETLFKKLEKQQDPETVYEKDRCSDAIDSPFKTYNMNMIKLKGVTKRITKMDLSDSGRKKKETLQSKLQNARNKLKGAKSHSYYNDTAVLSDTFGLFDAIRDNMNSRLPSCNLEKSNQSSWASTPGYRRSDTVNDSLDNSASFCRRNLNSNMSSKEFSSELICEKSTTISADGSTRTDKLIDEEGDYNSPKVRRDLMNNMNLPTEMLMEAPFDDGIIIQKDNEMILEQQAA